MILKQRPIFLALSSPSGAGKSSVAQHLLKQDKCLKLSISVTTRPPRPDEIDGIHYHFKDMQTFQELLKKGAFLEHANVFGYDYGTLSAPLEQTMHDTLFDVDWQGVQQLKQKMREDVVSVFLLPPSLKILEKRLHKRNQDTQQIIQHRMSKAKDEMSHWAEYDYVLFNDSLEETVKNVRAILRSEKCRRIHQPHLSSYIQKML